MRRQPISFGVMTAGAGAYVLLLANGTPPGSRVTHNWYLAGAGAFVMLGVFAIYRSVRGIVRVTESWGYYALCCLVTVAAVMLFGLPLLQTAADYPIIPSRSMPLIALFTSAAGIWFGTVYAMGSSRWWVGMVCLPLFALPIVLAVLSAPAWIPTASYMLAVVWLGFFALVLGEPSSRLRRKLSTRTGGL